MASTVTRKRVPRVGGEGALFPGLALAVSVDWR